MRRDTRLRLPSLVALCLIATPALAASTPPGPAAAQPSLAQAPSPVVDSLIDKARPPLDVRKRPDRPIAHLQRVAHHVARIHWTRSHVARDLERPALSGVTLVTPLPDPGEPPHLEVPLPAYPLDTIATSLTTPPPAIVCHHVRREPYVPDPHLYREAAVACEPDIP